MAREAPKPLIPLTELRHVGEGLRRPESILATARGELFASDHLNGVREVGAPQRPLSGAPPGFLPNGFAMTRRREFLVANLAGVGGVWRIDPHWQAHPCLMEVDGEKLSTTNFVGLDERGRIWVSMSTRQLPREKAFNPRTRDGFIALVDEHGARIVADGIGFANECRVSPDGGWLYVNETYQRRLTRLRIEQGQARTRLGHRETVFEFGDGDFPDGLAFDATGAAWVACIVSNRVLRIEGGTSQLVLEDADPQLCERAETQFASGGLDRAGVDAGGQRSLRNVSSIAFGGPDLRTVYLGCLAGDRIASFRSPMAGARPPHWDF
jgi:sugar lactone lactonase YvrE